MFSYYIVKESEKSRHEILNLMNIYMRNKENFISYYTPQEFYTENYKYLDVLEYFYEPLQKQARFILIDIGAQYDVKFYQTQFDEIKKQYGYIDAIILAGTNSPLDYWKKQPQTCILSPVEFYGNWNSTYIENIEKSILLDIYVKILLGQIQKNIQY